MKRQLLAALAAAATLAIATGQASAANIINEWASVKAPPPPALKEVTVAPKTTALLVLDMVEPICNAKHHPSCPGTVPVVKKLIGEARAHHMMVVYTSIPKVPITKVLPELKAAPGDGFVQSYLDKFLHTDLQKVLKDKGITTVIDVGTSSNGAVITTSSEAAQRGFKVIVPVDAMSAVLYADQYTAWHLSHAPVISSKITLTETGMIKF